MKIGKKVKVLHKNWKAARLNFTGWSALQRGLPCYNALTRKLDVTADMAPLHWLTVCGEAVWRHINIALIGI